MRDIEIFALIRQLIDRRIIHRPRHRPPQRSARVPPAERAATPVEIFALLLAYSIFEASAALWYTLTLECRCGHRASTRRWRAGSTAFDAARKRRERHIRHRSFSADAAALRFHLRDPGDRPPIVAIFGGTGTGKSTILNRLLGSDISAASFRRTYTAGAIAVGIAARQPSARLARRDASDVDPDKRRARRGGSAQRRRP